jgi:mono/diheme cytochrome c family protein
VKRLLLLIALLIVACGDDVHPDVTAVRDPDSVAAGADLFAAGCANCHRDDLSGDIGPNLITSELGHPDSDFIDAVTNGKGDMPAFGTELSPAEIEQVVDFVRSVQAANLAE